MVKRLNKIYRYSIKEDEILDILKSLFKRWSLERNENEPFGDWCIRAGIIAETTEGNISMMTFLKTHKFTRNTKQKKITLYTFNSGVRLFDDVKPLILYIILDYIYKFLNI